MTRRIFYSRGGQNFVLILDAKGQFVSHGRTDQMVAQPDVAAFFDSAKLPRTHAKFLKLRHRFQQEFQRLKNRDAQATEFYQLFLDFHAWVEGLQQPSKRVIPANVEKFIASLPGPPEQTTIDTPEREMMDRFVDTQQPCFFPGCEQLRQEMEKLLDANGGETCNGCTRDRILTQFRHRALTAWRQTSPEI